MLLPVLHKGLNFLKEKDLEALETWEALKVCELGTSRELENL